MKNTPAQIKTPVEILIPVGDDVIDHGMSLVHELSGEPRNYLHEVSVERTSQDAIRYLMAAGYAQRCGWIANGKPGTSGEEGLAYWTYSKPFPLTVAAW